MNPIRAFSLLWWAEVRKVFTLGSGVATLALSAVVGLAAVAAMKWAADASNGAIVNGQPIQGLLVVSGVTVGNWALQARNFFVLPLCLLLATGQCFAGEIRDHTLREALVRPVARPVVLLAKLAALLTLSASALLVTASCSLLPGLALFGAEGEPGKVLLGYLASWPCDAGVVALGILASLLVHSVGGVVVGVVLVLMADVALRLLLKLASLLGASGAADVASWMPGEALSAWKGYADGWSTAPLVGLGVLLMVTLGASVLRINRMDVP